MTKPHKRRAARQKLKSHDAGRDRHNKALEHLKKERRAAEERARLGLKRKPKPPKKPKRSTLVERARKATAEQQARLSNGRDT